MTMVQSLVEQGLALRSNAKVKVRQPLAKFTYPIVDNDTIVLSAEMEEIIKDELNVKEVCRGSELSLDTEITLDLKQEGVVRDLMRAIQEERKNKDLNPKDNINLMIATPKSGSDSEIVLRNYEDMIKNGVNAANISYVTPEFILELASDITVPFLDESVSFSFEISTEIEAPAQLIK
jgi:isoleucyl-tRNA synthetase